MRAPAFLDRALFAELAGKAGQSPRRRAHHNLHEMSEPCHRLAVGLQPDTYIPPHRHLCADKAETLLVLQGRIGLLLFAESTKFYIDTWVIRWLFRHPMHVQKSAEEYLGVLRTQGFQFGERNVSYPYLWWSRSKDFGLLERWGIMKAKPFGQRDETLVNAVARKP